VALLLILALLLALLLAGMVDRPVGVRGAVRPVIGTSSKVRAVLHAILSHPLLGHCVLPGSRRAYREQCSR
jgi:hypothetical protein